MNKKRRTALIASALVAAGILSGCDSKETVTIDGEQYVQNGEEYIKIENTTMIFEPRTHIVQYMVKDENSESFNSYSSKTGYLKYNIEIPEGYELFDVEPWISSSESTAGVIYFFINTERVEVTSEYDINTNTYLFNNPGVVVKDMTLN